MSSTLPVAGNQSFSRVSNLSSQVPELSVGKLSGADITSADMAVDSLKVGSTSSSGFLEVNGGVQFNGTDTTTYGVRFDNQTVMDSNVSFASETLTGAGPFQASNEKSIILVKSNGGGTVDITLGAPKFGSSSSGTIKYFAMGQGTGGTSAKIVPDPGLGPQTWKSITLAGGVAYQNASLMYLDNKWFILSTGSSDSASLPVVSLV